MKTQLLIAAGILGNYRRELVTNGRFDEGTAGWTAGGISTLSIQSGALKANNTSETQRAFFGQNIGAFSAGQKLRVVYDVISDGTSKSVRSYLGSLLGNSDVSILQDNPIYGSAIVREHTFTANYPAVFLWFWAASSTGPNYLLIDNVSVTSV